MSPRLQAALRPDLPPTACFSVHATADPGAMPRVLELFAKRGLVPTSWISRVSGCDLTIDVQMVGLQPDDARYFARALRQIVAVETVLLSEKR